MENFTKNQSFYTTSTTSVARFPEEENQSIPMACLYTVISFIAVFGNLLVITAVCWDNSLRSYTSNYFLANLAVADLFQGLIAIPLRILEVMAVGYDPYVFCRIAIATAILFGGSSNLAILVVSVDRFFAVQYPYTYVRYSNMKCTYLVIACSWSVAGLLSIMAATPLGWLTPVVLSRVCRFPIYLNQNYILGMYVIVHGIPISTVVILYGFILKASLRHVRRIHTQELAVIESNALYTNGHRGNIKEVSSVTMRRKKRQFETIKQRKAAKTVSIIVGLFILLVVPIIAIDLAEVLGAPPAPEMLTKFCVFMIYANNCVNVLVYTGFNQDFRRAFKKIFVKCFRCLFGEKLRR